jgi:hypothetical protein
MAILSDADRALITAEYQRDCSAGREQFGNFNKADLRAAANAVDDWISTNAASFNTALPVAFRTGATASQKARLFMAIATKRFISGV